MKHSFLYLLLGVGAVSCGSSSTTPDASAGAASLSSAGGAIAGATAGAANGGAEEPAHAGAGVAGAPVTGHAGGGTGGVSAGGASNAGASSVRAGIGTGGVRAGSGGTAGAGTAAGSGSSAGSAGSAIVAPAGYKLVWHDEFDVDGPPNPADYNFEKGFARNEEAQWYQSANATVANGLLVIEARKETVQNPNYTGSGDWKTTRKTAEYTSSSLTTSGHQSFQYGHFEMRARIPTEAGMWPAWWTLGVSGEWPSNGEIDIMEFYQGKILANVATGTTTRWTAKWDSVTKQVSTFPADWSSQFHVWRMDWNDTKIDLYVDDALMNTTNLADMLNPNGQSPFRQAHYMLVNLAIGGINGGDPAATPFPSRYEVDYIRVFQPQ